MSKCVEVVGDVFPDYDDFGKLACDALTASFPEWRNETLANIMCKLVALTVKHRKEAGQHGPAAHSTLDSAGRRRVLERRGHHQQELHQARLGDQEL